MIFMINLKITIRIYVILPYLHPPRTSIQNFFWWGVVILQFSKNLVIWYYNPHAGIKF